MESTEVIRALSALAQASRLQVFRQLVVAGPEGASAGDIAQSQGMAANTLSFHLKELLNAGLITQERRGRHLIYRAHYAQMNGLLSYLTENCCQGGVCLDVSARAASC